MGMYFVVPHVVESEDLVRDCVEGLNASETLRCRSHTLGYSYLEKSFASISRV